MKLTLKKIIYTLSSVATFFIVASIMQNSAFAGLEVVYGESGGNSLGGDCPPSAIANYENGTSRSNCCVFSSRCPHWIIGNVEQFKTAVANGIRKGSDYYTNNEKEYNICTNQDGNPKDGKDPVERVVWVGTDHNNELVALNEGNFKFSKAAEFAAHGHDHVLKTGGWLEEKLNDATIKETYEKVLADHGGDSSSIAFFCVTNSGDATPGEGNIVSKSVATATDNGDSGETATANTGYAVNKTATATMDLSDHDTASDVSITFKHFLKVNKGNPPLATKYKTEVTATGTSAHQRPGGSNWSSKLSLLAINTAYKAYGSAQEYTVTVNIPAGAGTYTVCEKIEYYAKSKNNNVDTSLVQYTKACVEIKASNDGGDGDSICDGLKDDKFGFGNEENESQFSQYTDKPTTVTTNDNYRKGRNGALSRVTNATSGNELVQLVYAKPNDKIKFTHCYYPDAFKVYPAESTPANYIVSDSDNICYIVGKPGRYLFDLFESYAEGGGSGKCSKYGGSDTVGIDASNITPIISFSPKKTYRVKGNIDEKDLGVAFEQYVSYKSDNAEAKWQSQGYNATCGTDGHTCFRVRIINKSEEYNSNSKIDSVPANVIVPYNFDTEIKVSSSNGSVVYAGGSFTTQVSGGVISAKNKNRGKEYATATPSDSTTMVVTAIISPDALLSDADGSSDSVSDPLGYLSSKLTRGNISKSDDKKVTGWEKGPFNASNDDSASFSESFTTTVPDVEVGSKICTVAGIYHSDSHGQPDDDEKDDKLGLDEDEELSKKLELEDNTRGLQGFFNTSNGKKWRISNVVCRTIAKKPTFQVWNGGIYSASGISTSVTNKCPGVDKPVLNSRLYGDDDGCSSVKTFGSWTEYEAVALKKITNFASGAGFGYDEHVGYVSWNGSGGVSSDDDHYGGYDSTKFYSKFYNVSHISIANNKSGSSPIAAYAGNSNINIDNSTLSRILERYSGAGGCSNNIEGFSNNASGKVTVINCQNDDVTITKDIFTGNDTYYKIDQIPQTIIIAKNIKISKEVKNIDAWLIASGTINTCYEYKTSEPRSDDAVCGNLLTINGPVFAKNLILNRTAGSGVGVNSIDPAERFVLRADTYLWGYSQAEDFHQATSTYTRELAPRY